MSKRDYFEDIVIILRLLKHEYGKNVVYLIKEIYDESEKPITEEQLYHKLLEKKEDLTIYHNIVENDEIKDIIRDGMNLNQIFDEDYLDNLDTY